MKTRTKCKKCLNGFMRDVEDPNTGEDLGDIECYYCNGTGYEHDTIR